MAACSDAGGPSTEPQFQVAATLEEPLLDAAVALLPGRRLIVIGGADLSGGLHRGAVVVDLTSGQTRPTRCELRIPRRRAVARGLADGRVIVLGGDTGNLMQLLETEVFDPVTDCFSDGPSLAERRGDVEGAVLLPDGRLLVILGLATVSQDVPAGGAEILDAGQQRFRVLDRDLGRATQRASVAPLPDGSVLLTGGLEVGSDRQAAPTDRMVLYDAEVERFRELDARLSVPRQFHASATLTDGRVLLVGGGSGIGTTIIEEFTPQTEAIRSVLALSMRRLLATALPVSRTRVLIIGGKEAFGAPPLESTELVDLTAGRVSPGSQLPAGVGIGHSTFMVDGTDIVIFKPAGDPATDSTTVVMVASIR